MSVKNIPDPPIPGQEALRSNAQAPKRRFLSALKILVGLVTDPIVFVTGLAPLAIGQSMALVQSSVAHAGTDGYTELIEFLNRDELKGTLDYAFQFYSLFLGTVLLLFKFGKVAIAHYFHVEGNAENLELSAEASHIVLLIFIGLCVGTIMLFFLGGSAKPEILITYIHHMQGKRWGEFSWPPFNALFTWARGVSFVLGLGLYLLQNGHLPSMMYSGRSDRVTAG